MSFTIYISNKITELAGVLSEKIASKLENPLVPTHLVTQTKGMDNWLKFYLANNTGIAANLSFKTPADLIFEVYRLLGGTYAEKINRQQLDLLIFAILGQEEFIKKYKNQAHYFWKEGDRDELKQWEFASKIADLFDQYQIYRSTIIEEWNTTAINELPQDQQWQAFIWQRLKLKTENAVVDITETATFIIDALKDESQQIRLRQLMPDVYLFGLSIITPFHLSLFYVIGQYINMDWYISNPAPEYYWFEDEKEASIFLRKMKGKNVAHLNVGNELLTSWGKVIQNTFRMIFQTEEFINAIVDVAPSIPERPTLLGTVQRDIYLNTITPTSLSSAQINDNSIVITANYSKRREVEVLYNYIVHTFLNKKYEHITDRDIVVMVSDINAYAPFIRAVMDNAPYKFSYTIADESISNGDSIISALIAILEFNGTKFAAEQLLQLLSYKNISNKFGIYNLELIRQAVAAANIRYGIQNDYQESTDDTYLVSFQYGLQKIMYGLCFAEQTEFTTDKSGYTIEISDAVVDMQQLTCFSAFVQAIITHVNKRKSAKTLQEWESFINAIFEDLLFVEDLENDEQIRLLLKKIKHPDEVKLVMREERIGYEVYSKKIINSLNNDAAQNKFLSKGITFCSPLPFRNIPFKIVAMLGLNYDAFPRKEQKLDFDLIARAPKIGDRNVKNNDKHLFLESILSAQDVLYLSYCGKSVSDNKSLPPSILIDELLEYIQAGAKNVDIKKLLVQNHPLHSYSNQYNKSNTGLLPNYLIEKSNKWPIAPPDLETIEAKSALTNFSINQITKFFQNAINYYYTQALQVYFEREEKEIEEEEIFSLNKLQIWQLEDSRLKAILNNDKESHSKKTYLEGKLPLKNLALAYLQNVDELIEPLANTIKADIEVKKQRTLALAYEYKGYTFTGNLNNLFGEKLVYFSLSKLEKTLLQANLEYLFAIQIDENTAPPTIYHSEESVQLNKIDRDGSRKRLHNILDCFISLHENPVFYSLNTYDDKMKEDSFITLLTKKANEKAKYDCYMEHALNTLNVADQAQYFQQLNPIFKEILLDYAKQ